MLNWIYRKFGGVKPVVIDGFLYVYIAMAGSLEAILTSNEVYKYLNAYVVFYSKVLIAVTAAGATSLKMFRSTSYSEHQADKKKQAEDNTTMLLKSQLAPKPETPLTQM